MNALIAILLVKIIDPISFGLAFIIVLFSRSKWIILISAIITAICVETLLTSSQITRTWGQGIAPSFTAALVQTSISYLIVGLFRKKDVTDVETVD